MKKLISILFIFVLMYIALQVAVGLSFHADMWKWITAYWVTLTLKNLFDYVYSMIED